METKWNDCTKKLPEVQGKYLVVVDGYNGFRYQKIVNFSKNLHLLSKFDFPNQKRPGWCEMDSESGYYEVERVTHWMELPELPEE